MTFRENVRSLGFGLMFLGLAGVVVGHLNADWNPARTQANKRAGVSDDAPQRVREGSKFVEQLGEFHKAGSRIEFTPEGSRDSLIVLENLALERVYHDLELGTRTWRVTGTITEYLGLNYLLVRRAVLKQRSAVDAAQPRL